MEAPRPQAPPAPSAPRGEIVFEHVWFAYRGEDWVLRDVSFRVAPGERVAIVGATGSGKTTIIKLLDRLYDVQRGRVLVDGVDVREWNLPALRREIGVVLQDVFLFNGTVADNITLGRTDIARERVEACARRTPTASSGDAAATTADPRARQQSLGGQRQLLRVRARAGARPAHPDPRRGDVERRPGDGVADPGRAREAARAPDRGRHRAPALDHRAADRILVVHKHELREEGTHAELLALGGIYARLYALQQTPGRRDTRTAGQGAAAGS